MSDREYLLDTADLLLVGSARWLDLFAERVETRTTAAVHRVGTATAAIETVRSEPIDCLVTARALDGTTGVELVRRLRESSPTLPVVLGATAGSEAIASEAVKAGVTDYVAITEPEEQVAELVERTDRAFRSGRRRTTRRERARQFDAVFHDTQTATWVLDPDGAVARVNETARGMIDEDADALVGEPFWELPWWSGTAGTRRDVRRLVTNARDGQFGQAVVTRPPGGTGPILDLSVRPVATERGDLVSILVEGIDVTEQVALDRDLRESEQLHRVTLNNMTDTVLITDEDGAYTYVCPNVHFIFGYTVEEIRNQGSIQALLGEDLFDREELAARGVLKNIECTVTDKAGREHALLVNVREVSIQDGTLLYSCRDITKRKQREEALATLQETAREFLYTETHGEIARGVVEEVERVLGLPAGAVYLFDVDDNELRPAAHTRAMRDLNGPLPAVHADGETLPGHCFVDDETIVFDDVHEASRLSNRATGLRGIAYIPLGDHGVFVAGAAGVGAVDGITRELADLLAATAEAALDRVTRESKLREQDRELKRQNEQLAALNRINATIREIDQAIVRAETREEIIHTACERLTDTDRFAFAWVGAADRSAGTVEPRAWAGDEQGYLDGQPVRLAPEGTEPAGQTAATGEITVVENVAADLREDPWRSDALTRDFLSVLSIPLTYNDLTHGVLTVYADTRAAFDGTARAVLTELGGTIASALSAIERKHALLTTALTRLELRVEDSTFLLSRLARAADCTVSYQGGVQQTTDGTLVFLSVADADAGNVAAEASQLTLVEEATRISAGGTDGEILQLRLARPFLALELADHGAVFREATADPDSATLVVDVPDGINSRTILQLVRETVSTVTLRRKRRIETPAGQDRAARFFEQLTDRQLEVLQTAYYSGFFESPRENTGEEIAAVLDISPPAFYQHIRTVQRKLFLTLFEEEEPPTAGSWFNN